MARGLTAAEVAEMGGLLRRDGQPNARLVYRLTRESTSDSPFPQPVGRQYDPRLWRWPRVQVEAYFDGLWEAS